MGIDGKKVEKRYAFKLGEFEDSLVKAGGWGRVRRRELLRRTKRQRGQYGHTNRKAGWRSINAETNSQMNKNYFRDFKRSMGKKIQWVILIR